MRRVFVSLLAAAVAAPLFAQQPPKPAPTPPPPPPPPAGVTGATGGGMSITPVEPPKAAAIPVPDGPVVNKQELEGGLVIEDIVIGNGYTVAPDSAVVAFYHGTLKSNGTVFDSAFEKGEPVAFPLNGVIQGWQKGVPGMKVGGVRRLTIPAAMGYGAQERPKIPANSDLVFIIKLVDTVYSEDVKVGEGDAAEGRFVAAMNYTFKDASGKEVDKSDSSHPYIWLPGEMSKPGSQVDPVQMGLTGVKVGGKRKIHIPKEMNGAPPQLETARPQDVPLEMEVEVVALRNLAPRRPVMVPPKMIPIPPTGATGAAPTGMTGATGGH